MGASGATAVRGPVLLTPRILLECAVFVGTGVLSTMAAQGLLYAGILPWTGLLPLANYAGMIFAQQATAWYVPAAGGGGGGGGSAPHVTPPLSPTAVVVGALPAAAGAAAAEVAAAPFSISLQAFVPAAVALDLLGFALHVQGMQLAGSSLFQVLYSSVVVWAALGTRLLRGPVAGAFNRAQVTGIAVVLAGLAFTALSERGGGHGHGHEAAADVGAIVADDVGGPGAGSGPGAAAAAAASASVLLGVAASLACAIVYGAMYALSEVLMSGPQAPPPALAASYVGCGITAVLGLYVLAVLPARWAEQAARVRAAGLLSWPAVLACLALMMGSALAHSVVYYSLLPAVGAAAVGLLSAGRAVGVFLASGLLFCRFAPQQCFSLARAVTTVVVIGGIVLFTRGKAQQYEQQHAAAAAAAAAVAGNSGAKGER